MSKLLKLAREFSQLDLPTDPNLRAIAIQEYLNNENKSQEKDMESVSTIGRGLTAIAN